MKIRLFAILSAASLSGCATAPPSAPDVTESALILIELATVPEADRAEVGAAVATEIGARFRCPKGSLEFAALTALRLGFDTVLRPRILPASDDVVDRLRRATNDACGIVAANE